MITDNLCVDVDVSRSLTGMNELGRSSGKKARKKATNSTGLQELVVEVSAFPPCCFLSALSLLMLCNICMILQVILLCFVLKHQLLGVGIGNNFFISILFKRNLVSLHNGIKWLRLFKTTSKMYF